MRVTLWAVAVLFLIISLGVFAYLLKDKILFPANVRITSSDMINVVLLLVAVLSLFIAGITFSLANRTANQQQVALEASTKNATQQQSLLEKTSATLEAQLKVIQEQANREQERLARKPKVEVRFQGILLEVLKQNPTIELQPGTDSWHRLTFLVRNIGNTPVDKPVVTISATPQTIKIDQVDFRLGQKANHHTFQFSSVHDMAPYARVMTDYRFEVDVTAPEGVTEFSLIFRIFGVNLGPTEVNIPFQILRDF